MEADQHNRNGEQGEGGKTASPSPESATDAPKPGAEVTETHAAHAADDDDDTHEVGESEAGDALRAAAGGEEDAEDDSDSNEESGDDDGDSDDDSGSDDDDSDDDESEASDSGEAEDDSAAAAASETGFDESATRGAAAPGDRRRHHVAPALIALDRVDAESTYKVHPEGEVDLLATDIARVGQLFPIDVRFKAPDRFQVISGFRRVKALRFLHREKVLARLHTDLSDEDALLLALSSAIHNQPVAREQIAHVKERLEDEGRLTPLLRDMLDKAVNPDQQLEPENETEIDADELATTTAAKLGELNQDLALLADVFASLDDEKKLELLKQLRYSAELVAYLEGITS